ncbi:HPt (histidine-containing phosphotransfer) domain-containing protein [Silvibacterium bohemicum]|uniref:HPt (Histidine-containing phosphotransfer) domain-containing protein n=1 Tax=Silvibacterium bohemicum TaxID=1577686 RepID=A0A841JWE7_9BACT|nr:Hpt domain-containing protein [Silvibacterium bohemicum]MBB6142768.1 HPt (histidine-containing phosphotransfer) domain-containing protein [Silvibacterium bohemicum]
MNMINSSNGSQPDLPGKLEAVWKNNLPKIAGRVLTLRFAEQSLAQGTLDQVGRKEAESAAHKLAGILGTFGLPQGTALASKIEVLLSGDAHIDDEQRQELASLLKELETEIRSREA